MQCKNSNDECQGQEELRNCPFCCQLSQLHAEVGTSGCCMRLDAPLFPSAECTHAVINLSHRVWLPWLGIKASYAQGIEARSTFTLHCHPCLRAPHCWGTCCMSLCRTAQRMTILCLALNSRFLGRALQCSRQQLLTLRTRFKSVLHSPRSLAELFCTPLISAPLLYAQLSG